jgi:hypothetical protein
VILNSHAIKREKRGAGSVITAVPAPRVRGNFQPATHRQGPAVVSVALACSTHRRDAFRCQPETSKTGNTAGGIFGRRFVAFRGDCSEPVHGAPGVVFGRKDAPQSGAIFMNRAHRFWRVSIAPVTYLVRQLWRTNHAARTQGSAPFETRILSPKHCLGDTSIRLLLSCFPQPMGVDRKDYTPQVVPKN